MDQGEQLILIGDWNSEASETNIWMKTQVPKNAIYDLCGYSYVPITYQQSKYCYIDGIYCTVPLTENWGGFLSFGRLVGDHRAQCMELHESMLLGFRKHDIIPPMARNLCLEYSRRTTKFNDTLHKICFEQDIYQKFHIYIPGIWMHLQHILHDILNDRMS